jgi:hypothetical protein
MEHRIKMSISNIIEKVKKLLALSQSSNAHEAAAAAAKANALIDEYRLSVGQLQGNTEADDPIVHDRSEPLFAADRVMAWRKTLAMRLTKHYGGYIWNDITKRKAYYVVAGRKSDVEVLRYMFAYISLECERIAANQARGNGRTFAESYKRGFVDGVMSQLQASRGEAVKASSDPQGLVKLDERASLARQHVTAAVSLGKAKTAHVSRTDASAFYSGQSAGKAFHLGSALPGGKTRMLSQG